MREYFIGFNEIDYPEKTDPNKSAIIEVALRNYILSQADTVRLTQTETRYGFLFRKKGHDQDPKFQKTLEALKDDFIRKEIDKERYHIEQGFGQTFKHYFFKLSPRIKEIINKYTLVWMFWPQLESELYGFEDPSFYKDDRLIAHVISHENQLYLYLDEGLANSFMKQLNVEFKDTSTWR